MKVEIEISDNYVKVLSKWASVSRTLSESVSLLEKFKDEADEKTLDRIYFNIQELKDIGPALNHLHQAVRTEIWERDKQ